MLPDPVLKLLAAAFPGATIAGVAPTFGGFSNLSAAVTIAGRACVLKAAETPFKRADVRREARMLTLLAGHSLPTAELLALVEDGGWTVEVMAAAPGVNGLQLYTQEPAALPQVFTALGDLLARVHRVAGAPADADLLLAARLGEVRAALPALPLSAGQRQALAAALADPVWTSGAPTLVHGDAGIHNILWEGRITALLDWEWAGWGTPLFDLAWVYWTMRWRNVDASCWEHLLVSYSTGPATILGAAPAALRALALGQIAAILMRVQHLPAARDEWLRRLAWTLDLEFPALR